MPVGKTSNVYSIPHGAPFLNTLARAVIDGSILPKTMHGSSQSALSQITVYLPTRRAARALRAEFSAVLDGEASLLPRIRTLGDNDEEEFQVGENSAEPSLLSHEIVDPLWRQIQLARLVKKWVEMISEEARRLYRDENIIIPSSSAEALWLAREIGGLIDQLATEEISWTQLQDIVPQEHAQWWALTLDFLKIATQSWPLQLAQDKKIDVAEYRGKVIDTRCAALEKSDDPVIVAGSTGSIPATARFLRAVAQKTNGAVVLPGVDFSLQETVWEAIGGQVNSAQEFASSKTVQLYEDHPQYGLAHILRFLGTDRDEIPELGVSSGSIGLRTQLNSIAMLPSDFTDRWLEQATRFDHHEQESGIANIAVVNAPGERQEAMAIALILREALEDEQANAALITPDRNLARRVKAELKRFNLEIDDSAGMPLDSTREAIFIRLVINAVTNPEAGLELAALIKHPSLFAASNDPAQRQISYLFEISMVRDVAFIPGIGQLQTAIAARRAALNDQQFLNAHVARMDDEDWQAMSEFAARIDAAFAPLLSASNSAPELDIASLFRALNETLLLLGQSDADASHLFDSPAGQKFADIFATVGQSDEAHYACKPYELGAIFDALISGEIVRANRDFHPRLAIFGPLEARLQPIDVAVLGGLNEGTWPQTYDSGPFLNRPMKSAIGLSTPERRTGLAAHDFEQFMGYKKVFITRSERVDNAPSVSSRWLQRFLTVAGPDKSQAMIKRGETYLHWANLLDQPKELPGRIARPCPTPPLSARPRRLSITDIETWIRDPYAIYAKRILKLAKLPLIGLKPEPVIRGILLHDALAEYISKGHDPSLAQAHTSLMEFIEQEARAQQVPQHLMAIWLPQFKEIAEKFLEDEIRRSKNITEKFCEIDGKMVLANGEFELYGRADRVDLRNDGRVEILDYKTGDNPSAKEARSLSPQLALEGAIALAGGFKGVASAIPEDLQFVRLKAHGNFKTESITNKEYTAQELSAQARQWLEAHIDIYNDITTGYLSRYAVARELVMDGDYDHLARVREWSWGSDDEAGGADE